MMDNLNLQEISGFKVQLVGEKTWAIDDFGIDIMYLIMGEEKALLIDTGMGMGNLRAVVETLTDLPVLVVNTHGHHDHMGGNDEFSDLPIYIHPKDAYMLKEHLIQDYSESWKKSFATPGFYGQEYYDLNRKFREVTVHPLRGGDILDLGNRHLEVITVPGHTAGSIVLLDLENGYLFSGDSVVSTPTLIVSEMGSVDISKYREALLKLNARKEEINLIFPGHFLRPIENSYIDSLIALCGQILEGSCRSEEFDLSFVTDRRCVISRYKKASIVYAAENL